MVVIILGITDEFAPVFIGEIVDSLLRVLACLQKALSMLDKHFLVILLLLITNNRASRTSWLVPILELLKQGSLVNLVLLELHVIQALDVLNWLLLLNNLLDWSWLQWLNVIALLILLLKLENLLNQLNLLVHLCCMTIGGNGTVFGFNIFGIEYLLIWLDYLRVVVWLSR